MTLPDLKVSQPTPSVEPSAASAALLTNFGVRTVSSDKAMANHSSQETQMYSLVARLDGALVVQGILPDGASIPNTRRVVPLGGGPITLTLVPAQGAEGVRVIAAGKQAVALSVMKKRLYVSSLPIKVSDCD
jgi:hypothetical protein